LEGEGEGRHRDSLVARAILRRRGLVVKEPISVIKLRRGRVRGRRRRRRPLRSRCYEPATSLRMEPWLPMRHAQASPRAALRVEVPVPVVAAHQGRGEAARTDVLRARGNAVMPTSMRRSRPRFGAELCKR